MCMSPPALDQGRSRTIQSSVSGHCERHVGLPSGGIVGVKPYSYIFLVLPQRNADVQSGLSAYHNLTIVLRSYFPFTLELDLEPSCSLLTLLQHLQHYLP